VLSDINQDNITATLNGLLTVTLLRIHDKTSKEPKKILINQISTKGFILVVKFKLDC